MVGNISILDVGPVIFGNSEELIDFPQQKHLLASNMVCSNCGTAMGLRQKSDISDGCIFRCGSCKTTKSLRAGSFFRKSKLSLQQWLELLYWWVCEYPVTDVAEEPRVGRDTAIDAYQWFREVCSTELVQTPIQLEVLAKLFRLMNHFSGTSQRYSMILMNNNNIMSSCTTIISLGSRMPLKITAMGICAGGYFCRTSFRVCTDSTERDATTFQSFNIILLLEQ